MKRVISAYLLMAILFVACDKKEKPVTETPAEETNLECGNEIMADQPVKVGETGLTLPAGSRLCISEDQLSIKVELPSGFEWIMGKGTEAERSLPVYATYACYCSVQASACKVFYADGLGFGCLQSSCSGSCTGKFTYKGYTVDRVVTNLAMEDVLKLPELQKAISNISPLEAWSNVSMYGISFYVVNDEKKFLATAACECDGTRACKLQTLSVLGKKIYFCEGACNGCELTV